MKNRIKNVVGNILHGTPFYIPVLRLYNMYRGVHFIKNHKTLPTTGYYSIQPSEELSSFEMYLPIGHSVRIDDSDSQTLGFSRDYTGAGYSGSRLNGDYEPPVTKILKRHLNNTSVFWELGAQFGYYSLLVSPIVDEVLAVEGIKDNVECIKKSSERNGYSNITIEHCLLGINKTLDELVKEHSAPDVVLMDIEGWETKVLEEADTIFSQTSTWIVETHSKPELSGAPYNENTHDDIINIFKNRGFKIEKINEERLLALK